MKILLVEPDPFQIKLIRKTLGEDRFQVRATHDGDTAWSHLQEEAPDLVILDRDLPGTHGLELCRKIRDDGRLHALPVIFLTSHGEPADVTAALKAGAQDYIVKGASPQEIVARVDAQLSHARMVNRLLEFKKQIGLAHLVTGLCHEILNPLTILSGNLELLASMLPPGSHLAELEDSHELCFRMSRSISHLKQYTEGTQAPFESIELKDVIDHLVEIIEIAKMQRGKVFEFVIEVADTPPILAQRERLGQAILNLLMNAMSATPEGGSIRLVLARDRQQVTVTVEDRGDGIEPDQLDRIFEPFFTTRAPNDGVGLGLAVARKIVREHGGEILVESSPGQGSTFTIAIPIPRNTRPIPILPQPTMQI